jgi:hypothetical protein
MVKPSVAQDWKLGQPIRVELSEKQEVYTPDSYGHRRRGRDEVVQHSVPKIWTQMEESRWIGGPAVWACCGNRVLAQRHKQRLEGG